MLYEVASRVNDLQLQEFFEGVEVAVGVEERMRVAQAERRDEAVDGLPDRAASLTELAGVARGGRAEFDATGFENFELSQSTQHAGGIVVGRESLQDLANHIDRGARVADV